MFEIISDSVNKVDKWLTSNNVLYLIVSIVLLFTIAAIFVTAINASYYWTKYDLCWTPVCFVSFVSAFKVQIGLIKAGVAFATFVALIFGSYIALREHLNSSRVGAFGNRMAHVGFFERFVVFELDRRRKLNTSSVDIFSIYRLMFPASHANEAFASDEFVNAINQVFDVVRESSNSYEAYSSEFKFDDHRNRFISSLSLVYIRMEKLPRIDFLEVEDEVLDFLKMLSRLFAPPGSDIEIPVRKYR